MKYTRGPLSKNEKKKRRKKKRENFHTKKILLALLDIKNSFRQVIYRHSLHFLFHPYQYQDTFFSIDIKALCNYQLYSVLITLLLHICQVSYISLYIEMHAYTFYFIAISDIINSAFRVELRIVVRNNAVILLYYDVKRMS